VLGLANLRGTVVSVIDLEVLLGYRKETQYRETSSIIRLRHSGYPMAAVADWQFIDESGRTLTFHELPLAESVRQKQPLRDYLFGSQVADRVRWFSGSLVPMTELDMFAGFLVEVTELVNARQEIAQFAASLEDKVARRTKELQEINAELEAFSYSISHDLKAPLSRAENWLYIFQHEFRAAIGEKGLGMLLYVRSEIGAMQRMIEAMLVLSRIARSNIERVEVDLAISKDFLIIDVGKSDSKLTAGHEAVGN
jgi:signal transduction histidine kinase